MNIRKSARAAERDAAYQYALAVVNLLEPDPRLNTCCKVAGKRCHTLEEAVRTITGEEPIEWRN